MRRAIGAVVLGGLLAVLLVASARAQDDKDGKKKLQAVLLLQERQVLDAWKKGELTGAANALPMDYAEVLPYRKERILKADWQRVRSQAKVMNFNAEGSELTMLAETAALLSYKFTWDGSQPGKEDGEYTWLVSTIWNLRGERWVCTFRQATEVERKELVRDLGDAFAIATTTNGLRYQYKGTGKLEDLKTTLALTLPDAKVTGIERYWGSWQAGEIKEVTLNQLVPLVNSIERVDFAGTATLEGRKVRFATTVRK